MKKSTSWLIAGLVFLLAGVVIFGITSALIGFDFTRMEIYFPGGFIF